MKNYKGLIGLAAFVSFLWAVIVTSYASQINAQPFDSKDAEMAPMQTSCSSSTSTSTSSGE